MNINPITAVSSYFKNRKEAKARKRKELAKLRQMHIEKNEKEFYQKGFNKITFPIFLIDGDANEETNEFEFCDYDFNIVWDLNEFVVTDWYHSASMQNECQLIDCNGEVWDFKYNNEVNVCTPGKLLIKMELHEIKQFIIDSIGGYKNESKVKDAVERADSMSELFELMRPYHY